MFFITASFEVCIQKMDGDGDAIKKEESSLTKTLGEVKEGVTVFIIEVV